MNNVGLTGRRDFSLAWESNGRRIVAVVKVRFRDGTIR